MEAKIRIGDIKFKAANLLLNFLDKVLELGISLVDEFALALLIFNFFSISPKIKGKRCRTKIGFITIGKISPGLRPRTLP